ncbi:MAG: PcfJ domain-containing protein [Alphaproteobacteria bacterium]|nr:PcfJ domain-containing protein [Alphaproteobacteria bacterium]
MALNLLNDLSLNEYLTDISYQGRTVPKQQGIHGEFESADYVLSHTDEIARGILNQYIKHRVREYILKQGNEPAFVPVDANRPDLPDWAKNVLARGEAVYEFDGTRMSDNLKNDITTVRDYLYDIATTYVDKVGTTAKNTKRKPKIRYDFLKTNNEYQTFEMALSAAHAWHEKIAAGLKDRLKSKEMLEKSLQGVEFVMELPGNMAAYKLTTSAALDFESEYMGHCVGSGGYDNGVADGTTQIYSIRDERGEPHVTFEVRGNSIKQVKGKQNKRPVAKYMPAVQAFVHANNFDIDGDIKNTGLIKQDGKYYDIFHLPRGFVVHGNLDLSDMDLTMLPDMSNVVVQGDFSCSSNQLTSLQGAPQSVGGKFNCGHNQLTSLQGAPQSVGGDFYCSHNQLTSLQGAPQSVGGSFYCSSNLLTSLQGAPQSVGGDFMCRFNQLTSLQDSPQSVGGDFDCSSNRLTSLQGAPQSVGGNFDCSRNRLTSLQGSPQSVGGYFDCSSNRLTSLQGAPQSVGEGFYCNENQLTSLQGAPQRVGGNFNCGSNQLTSLQGVPQKIGMDFICDDELLKLEYQEMILERESQDKKCSIKFKNATAKLLAETQQLSKPDSGHDI